MDSNRRDALATEYGEVGNNFRLLTDIRFKLVGLLPIAAAAGAAFSASSNALQLPLALFGLTVTLGVVTYNERNDQLYNALIGRAAAIERSLGLPDGAFVNRPRPWLSFAFGPWEWEVSHGQGLGTIYTATVALWLFLIFHVFFKETFSALLAAFVVVLLFCRGIAVRERARRRDLRRSVKEAVALLNDTKMDFQKLSDEETQEGNSFVHWCTCALVGNEKNKDAARARIKFYFGLCPEVLEYYAPFSEENEVRAAFIVALLTDLPPMWILDAHTGRRGNEPKEVKTGPKRWPSFVWPPPPPPPAAA